jgi:ATP-dependent DNA ligase
MEIKDFAMMTPMKYYDNPEPAQGTSAFDKRLEMIENVDGSRIATVKHDGDWGCLIHYSMNHNLIRSRSLSKVTGVYGDYTEKLPQITDEMNKWPDGTVILAELCFDEPHASANTAGTILRCLAKRAIERQKVKPLRAVAFDMLMIGGRDLTSDGYANRFAALETFLRLYKNEFIYPTKSFDGNFMEHADEIIAAGGEGLVIQYRNNPYMPGTRTAWKTLKLKQSMPHIELKVLRTLEPTKVYDGDMPESWPYKLEDGTLVTRPYFKGWKNGVVVDFHGVEVSVTSGLTDDDREYLASEEAQKLIAAGKLYAEVKAMQVNSRGALRHPVLIRLRDDYE